MGHGAWNNKDFVVKNGLTLASDAYGITYPDGSQQTTAYTGTVAYSNVTDAPTNVSSFTNDAGYITSSGNPFNQSLNSTDNVVFNEVDARVIKNTINDSGQYIFLDEGTGFIDLIGKDNAWVYRFKDTGLEFPDSTVQTTAALNTSSFTQVDIGTIKLRDNAGVLDAYVETLSTSTVGTAPALLYNFNSVDGSGNLTDESGNTTLTLNGETTFSTDQSRFGGASLYIGNSATNNNYAAINETVTGSLDLGTGDYTIEGWVYPLDSSNTTWTFVEMYNSVSDSHALYALDGSGTSKSLVYVNGPDYARNNTVSLIDNQWNHIAFSRSAGVLYFSVNGVTVSASAQSNGIGDSNTDNILYNSSYSFIGTNRDTGDQSVWGYVDSVRITKGTAVYSGNTEYTVPTAEFTGLQTVTSITTSTAYPAPLGNLTLPLGGTIQEFSITTGTQITITPGGGAGPQLSIYPTTTEGNHIHLASGNLASTSLFLGNDTQYVRTGVDGSMVIGTDDGVPESVGYGNRWKFDTSGAITFPSQSTNSRTGSGDALVFAKDGAGQKIIATQAGDGTYNTVERLVIAGGDGYANGEGGDIYLWAGKSGHTGGTGGDIKVDAGDAYDSQGGTVKIRGGNVYNGDNSVPGEGGFIEILAGHSYNGGEGGNVVIAAGNSYNGTPIGGSVAVQTHGGTWQFGNDGHLTFPDNTVQTSAYTGEATFDANGTIVLPTNTVHLSIDSSAGDIVNLATDASFSLSGFSGEVLINDLYDGYVYKFLVGGGWCTLVSHTNGIAITNEETVTNGPASSVGITNWVSMSSTSGYTFTNLAAGTADRDFSIVTIRSRAST